MLSPIYWPLSFLPFPSLKNSENGCHAYIRWVLALLTGLFMGTAAGKSYAENGVSIGVLLPLSGDFAFVGNAAQKAIVENYSSSTLRLVWEDSPCDAKRALSAYKKLTEINKIRIFLGPCCGNELESVAPLLTKNNAVMLSVCSSTERLFQRSSGRILSPVFSIEQESRFNAHLLESSGFHHIAIVYYENSFSQEHARAFRDALKSTTVTDTYTIDQMDPEQIRAVVMKLKNNPPDALYVPDLTPFLLSLSRQLKVMGLRQIPIYSIHAAQTDNLLRTEGPAAEGLRYSHPDIGGQSADGFFAGQAIKLVTAATASCGQDLSCIQQHLMSSHSFNENGTTNGALIVKTVKNGKFEEYTKR